MSEINIDLDNTDVMTNLEERVRKIFVLSVPSEKSSSLQQNMKSFFMSSLTVIHILGTFFAVGKEFTENKI